MANYYFDKNGNIVKCGNKSIISDITIVAANNENEARKKYSEYMQNVIDNMMRQINELD